MKSPFPGMDPFIEGYGWASFHLMALAQVMQEIIPHLPEGYLASTEVGITASDLLSGDEKYYRPDVGILEDAESDYPSQNSPTATITPPKAYVRLGQVKQRTVTIRTRAGEDLITAIELLSPANKQGTGLAHYRNKRDELIRSEVNLVEIDLLRGGTPPFIAEDWPKGTYRFQAVEASKGMVGFWTVGLGEQLPRIGIPLLPTDAPIALDLQRVVDNVYTYSTYARSLRYEIDRLRPAADAEERKVILNFLPEKM